MHTYKLCDWFDFVRRNGRVVIDLKRKYRRGMTERFPTFLESLKTRNIPSCEIITCVGVNEYGKREMTTNLLLCCLSLLDEKFLIVS